MSAIRPLTAAVVAAIVSGCFAASLPPEYPSVVRAADAPSTPSSSSSTATPTVEQDEATLPKEARLDPITRVALARSPIVKEARARTHAALARVKGTGRLPDLEFKYELWGQPLSRPWALNETQMHMFGLRQTFPALGSLDAQTRVAVEEARVALELQHARELDVMADVRKAWTGYRAAFREKAIHVDHASVNERIFALAKAQLPVGKVNQSDVLRVEL
jgi:outer membrane protein TolC